MFPHQIHMSCSGSHKIHIRLYFDSEKQISMYESTMQTLARYVISFLQFFFFLIVTIGYLVGEVILFACQYSFMKFRIFVADPPKKGVTHVNIRHFKFFLNLWLNILKQLEKYCANGDTMFQHLY